MKKTKKRKIDELNTGSKWDYIVINNGTKTLFLILSRLSVYEVNSLLDLNLEDDLRACLLLYYRRFNTLIEFIKNTENKNKISSNEVFRDLVKNKNIKDNNKYGILYYSVIRKDLNMINFLFSCGVDVDIRSFATAVIYELEDISSLLHANSIKVKNFVNDFIFTKIKEGGIHEKTGFYRRFIFLFDKFFSMSSKDLFGNNILHYAARFSNLEIFKLIFAKSKNLINEKNYRGVTPLYETVFNPNVNVISYFVEEIRKSDLSQNLVNNNNLSILTSLLSNIKENEDDKENRSLNLS